MSKTGKTTVKLSQDAVRPSRIRRDPPPPPARVKERSAVDDAERETLIVAIGVTLFAIAITIIIFGFADFTSR